jgi:transcriptional regulator with XRE-family HTH domain
MSILYANLSEYITTRARDFGYSTAALSQALGYGRSYISGVIHGQFKPSQERCWEIAEFFGDDPNIILGLAGYYKPAPDTALTLTLTNIADALPQKLKRTLVEYALFLKQKMAVTRIQEQRAPYRRDNVLYLELGDDVIELELPSSAADLSLNEIGDVIIRALEHV